MARDVGEGFLDNAVGCDLDGSRQRWQIRRSLNVYQESCRGSWFSTVLLRVAELGSAFTDGRDQTQLVQGWRAQFIDEAANVSNGCSNIVLQRVRQRDGDIRVGRDHVANVAGSEGERCQRRTKTVMQVAAQAAALLLARENEVLARALHIGCHALQVCRELYGM